MTDHPEATPLTPAQFRAFRAATAEGEDDTIHSASKLAWANVWATYDVAALEARQCGEAIGLLSREMGSPCVEFNVDEGMGVAIVRLMVEWWKRDGKEVEQLRAELAEARTQLENEQFTRKFGSLEDPSGVRGAMRCNAIAADLARVTAERDALRGAQRPAVVDVLAERARQDRKWGEQNHEMRWWMSILGEEFGEACKEANDFEWHAVDGSLDRLRTEASHVAAVAVAVMECIDRAARMESPDA